MAPTSPPLRVSELWIYPVKSLRGIRVAGGEIDAGGFRYDRRYMLVDPTGEFVTQRQLPHLARVATRIDARAGVLELSYDGGTGARLELPLEGPGEGAPEREVTVWDDRVRARSAGDAPRRWLTEQLGAALELVYVPPGSLRTTDAAYDPTGTRVGFADGYPFLLACEASLAALNARLAAPVPMERFRPNIVVAGGEPWQEDAFGELRIGEVPFAAVKPCGRCVVITVDQRSGDKDAREPLATLASLRKRADTGKVIFGQNLVHRGTGRVREGDAVER